VLLSCPWCGWESTSIDDLNEHLWERHTDDVPLGDDTPDQNSFVECTGCDVPIRNDTLVYHIPCFEDQIITAGSIRWIHNDELFLCPICGAPESSESEFNSHIKSTHSIGEQYNLIVDPETDECVGCGQSRSDGSTESHAVHYLDQHPVFSKDSPGNDVSCPVQGCGTTSGSLGTLPYHLWSTHFDESSSIDKDGVCPGCGETLSISDVIDHLQCFDSISGPGLLSYYTISFDLTECFLCEFSTYNRGKLEIHIRDEHIPSILEYGCCPGCGEEVQHLNRSELVEHYLCFAEITGENIPLRSKDTDLICPDCQKAINTRSQLIQHTASEHIDKVFPDTSCSWCDERIQIEDDIGHISCIWDALTEKRYSQDSNENNNDYSGRESTLATIAPPAVSGSVAEIVHTAHNPLDSSEETEHYQDLNQFLEFEREAAREESWKQFENNTASGLAYQNQAIPELMSISKQHHPDYEHQYVFEHLVPDHVQHPNNLVEEYGIYPRSEVILDANVKTDILPEEFVVSFINDQTIGVALKSDRDYNMEKLDHELQNLDSGHNEVTYDIYHLLNPTPYDRQQDAINKSKRNSRINSIISGDADLKISDVDIASIIDPELNPPQQQAVNQALGAKDLACIHGPPGTGKTRTLTAIIKAAVARGDTVLAVAHSNQAVDNLIVGTSTVDAPDKDSLHYAAKEGIFDIARIGRHSSNNVMQEYHMNTKPSNAEVVAGTMSAAAEVSADFDWVVVDEATQASQPATLMPLLKGSQIILAGDHKQLPPFASSEDAKREEMHISLFEHILKVYGEELAERLLTQYRMNETIAEYPSQQFYNNTLTHGNINRNWTIGDLEPLLAVHTEGNEQTDPDTKSKYNPDEAKIVAEQTEMLLESGIAPEDIGIITPYTAQIGTIASELHNIDIENPRRIDIDTVDSFQGGERTAIIVSFVRSNSRNTAGFLEFPEEGPRRLNVAITRAQKRLTIIGDFETLGTVADHRDDADSCAELYETLREYCAEKASYLEN
jgi:hypothetical protein